MQNMQNFLLSGDTARSANSDANRRSTMSQWSTGNCCHHDISKGEFQHKLPWGGECPIILHFHHILSDQADVFHQLITCYDVTKTAREAEETQQKKNTARVKEDFYEDCEQHRGMFCGCYC